MLFTQHSSIMLKAHGDTAPGLTLESCTRERRIKHNNVSYSDNNDGHVLAPPVEDNPTGYVIERLHKSTEVWNKLIQLTRGALALHKIHWRLMAWRLERGELKIMNATEEVIMMEDGKEAYAVVDFIASDEGLEYCLCPDGNQRPIHTVIMQELEELSNNISSAQLSER